MEKVSDEVADVNPLKRMNFASNSIFGKNPTFVDLRLSTAHTADKLKSILVPNTRAKGLVDKSDWPAPMHRIAEVTEDIVREAKAYSDYIKNSEFESMNVSEQENNSGTRLNENIQMTRPDQNIQMT